LGSSCCCRWRRRPARRAGTASGVRRDARNRDLNEFREYREADKDYNSRFGNRYEYQQYFRRGFENGYRDGLNGY
jgi:hypothetical protein